MQWDSPEEQSKGKQIYGYVIYRFEENEPLALHNPANIIKISFDHTLTSFTDERPAPGHTYRYVVTAIDRIKNESTPAGAFIKRIK